MKLASIAVAAVLAFQPVPQQAMVLRADTYAEAYTLCVRTFPEASVDRIDCINAAALAWYGRPFYWKA